MSGHPMHRCALRLVPKTEPEPKPPADHRRRVPFNTGRVQIGIAHIPKPQPMTADQERMQAALLDPRTAAPQSLTQRLLGAIWRWL